MKEPSDKYKELVASLSPTQTLFGTMFARQMGALGTMKALTKLAATTADTYAVAALVAGGATWKFNDPAHQAKAESAEGDVWATRFILGELVGDMVFGALCIGVDMYEKLQPGQTYRDSELYKEILARVEVMVEGAGKLQANGKFEGEDEAVEAAAANEPKIIVPGAVGQA